MRTHRQNLRWGVRNSLAILFWVHALGITALIAQWSIIGRLPSTLCIQVALISAICFYGWVAENGSWSMIADALYIYVSPVVLLARVTWIVLKKTGKALANVSPSIAELFKKEKNEDSQKKDTESATPSTKWSTDRVAAPFLHFSVCWCVLVGISKERWMLAVCLGPLLCIATRTIAGVHVALNDASRLMDKMGDKLKLIVENITREVTSAAPNSKEFQQSAQNIRIYGALIRYLASTEAVRNVTRRFTLAIAIPTYVYTSLLCGFIYFDIAKLEGLNWHLGEALTDALYMPIAWTDLPHNYAIRLLAGLQVGCLILIGYDAIFRSINASISRLATAAHGLSSIIEGEKVSVAMRSFDLKKSLIIPAPSASKATIEEPSVTSPNIYGG